MAVKRLTNLVDVFSDDNLGNTIYGLAGNDTINGNGGNDIIDGGTGRDTMRGGLGNDIYYVDDALDQTIELFNQGNDSVRSSVARVLSANVENLFLLGTGTINGFGNALNNYVAGNAAANYISGADGNDTLDGGLGADFLSGGLGSDILIGGGGNDSLIGGEGDDYLDGGAGADNINGGVGLNDRVSYQFLTAADAGLGIGVSINLSTSVFAGIAANRAKSGGAGETDVVTGIENVTGSAFNDVIVGNDATANILLGGAGHDSLYGFGNDDFLVGGTGNDFLDGGNGQDLIFGSQGSDYMRGGLDIDTFRFLAGDSRFGNVTANDFDDIIFDYFDLTDRIDFSAIAGVNSLANLSVVNYNHYVFGAGAYIQFSPIDFVFVVGYSTAQVSASDFIF